MRKSISRYEGMMWGVGVRGYERGYEYSGYDNMNIRDTKILWGYSYEVKGYPVITLSPLKPGGTGGANLPISDSLKFRTYWIWEAKRRRRGGCGGAKEGMCIAIAMRVVVGYMCVCVGGGGGYPGYQLDIIPSYPGYQSFAARISIIPSYPG